jgi:ABC-type proline/glycine betaine transport system substrate-binding protein
MSHIRVKLVRRATPRAQIASSGKLVSISQVTITSGIVISHCIDYAFAESQGISPTVQPNLRLMGALIVGIGLAIVQQVTRWPAS